MDDSSSDEDMESIFKLRIDLNIVLARRLWSSSLGQQAQKLNERFHRNEIIVNQRASDDLIIGVVSITCR